VVSLYLRAYAPLDEPDNLKAIEAFRPRAGDDATARHEAEGRWGLALAVHEHVGTRFYLSISPPLPPPLTAKALQVDCAARPHVVGSLRCLLAMGHFDGAITSAQGTPPPPLR
jgi:hypothetical protein